MSYTPETGAAPNVGFRAWRGSSQVLNTLTETKIQFDNDADDDGGDFDSTTNYYFVAPTAGRYVFSCTAEITLAAAGRGEVRLFKNSTEMRRGDSSFESAGTIYPHVSMELKLAASDTVEIRGWQNTGFAATIQATDSNFSGVQVSEI
jgi:hypothetical protein